MTSYMQNIVFCNAKHSNKPKEPSKCSLLAKATLIVSIAIACMLCIHIGLLLQNSSLVWVGAIIPIVLIIPIISLIQLFKSSALIQHLKQGTEALKQEASILKQENEILSENVTALTSLNQQLQIEVSLFSKSNKDLKSLIESLEKLALINENKLDEIKQLLSDLFSSEDKSSICGKLDSIIKSLNGNEENLSSGYSPKLQELTLTIKELLETLDPETIIKHKSIINELNETQLSLSKKIDELQKQQNELTLIVQSQQNNLNHLQEQSKNLEQIIILQKQQLEELKSLSQAVLKQIQDLQRQIK